MAPPPRRPPELMEELVGEILLRLPPDEPAHLARAAVVCKQWLRLLSSPAFRRGYRAFHRTPPMLGFLHNLEEEDTPRFVPATAACPIAPPAFECDSWYALDCHHGRVLIHTWMPTGLIVWDPITGDQEIVPVPVPVPVNCACCTGAVLCAAAGCDHLDCSRGPFLVVFLITDEEWGVTLASMYSSETGAWSDLTSLDSGSNIEMAAGLLIGDVLYFMFEDGEGILMCDLNQQSLSVVDPPELYNQGAIVMTAEDGGLGFVGMEGHSLYLYSRGADGGEANGNQSTTGWALCRVMKLDTLLPIPDTSGMLELVGFLEGTDTVFVSTYEDTFTLELKSGRVKKAGEISGSYSFIVPCLIFYTPGHSMG